MERECQLPNERGVGEFETFRNGARYDHSYDDVLIRSRMRFRLAPKSSTLETLDNIRHALYYRKDASFGAHHKNFNENRPKCQRQIG